MNTIPFQNIPGEERQDLVLWHEDKYGHLVCDLDISWEKAKKQFKYYRDKIHFGFYSTKGDPRIRLRGKDGKMLCFYSSHFNEVYFNPNKTDEQWLEEYTQELVAFKKAIVREQGTYFNDMKKWPGEEEEYLERIWIATVLCGWYPSDDPETENSNSLCIEARDTKYDHEEYWNARKDCAILKKICQEKPEEFTSLQDKEKREKALALLREHHKEHNLTWTIPEHIL